MKTRLIALIDFSLYSQALIELASRWCSVANAELVLLHKVPGMVPALVDSRMKSIAIEAEKNDALERLKTLAQEKISASIPVAYHVSDKNLILSLTELTADDYTDYILVGIRGTGMLKRILMGSMATHVINELNQITVAVPEKLCPDSDQLCNFIPKKVVVTITDKYPVNHSAFENFLNTFQGSIEEIKFVSVIGEEESDEEADAFLSEAKAKYTRQIPSRHRIFRGANVFDAIKQHVRHDNDTVLVIQKGSRTLTDQFFRRFLINDLVHDGSIPMVVLPVA